MNKFYKLAKLYNDSLHGFSKMSEFEKASNYLSTLTKQAKAKTDIDGAWYKNLDDLNEEEEVDVYDSEEFKDNGGSALEDDGLELIEDETGDDDEFDVEFSKTKEDIEEEIQDKETMREVVVQKLRNNYSKEVRREYIKLTNELNKLYDELGKTVSSNKDDLPTLSTSPLSLDLEKDETDTDDDFDSDDNETSAEKEEDDFVPEMVLTKEEFDNDKLNDDDDDDDFEDDDDE